MPTTTESLGTIRLLAYAPLAAIGLVLLVAVRRLFFHPLSHIPGPKLAAVTWFYQTYYSFAGEGSQYYLKIEKLHEIYGMDQSPHARRCWRYLHNSPSVQVQSSESRPMRCI